MKTRIVLGGEFVRAIKVRGLTPAELAKRARISVPTVSSAIKHRPINVSSALRLCNTLDSIPVIEALDRWVDREGEQSAA
jgi:predicted transcriptional regulator